MKVAVAAPKVGGERARIASTVGTDLLGLGAMAALATGVVVVVALLHAWFLVLEMFLWQTPYGMRTFGTTPEFAAASAVLAANQGLYNGFLAAGLLWTLASDGVVRGRAVLTFFLGCVVVAGIYGAATANPRIFWVQGLPAIVALAAVWATPATARR